jgi:hypothetical protein
VALKGAKDRREVEEGVRAMEGEGEEEVEEEVVEGEEEVVEGEANTFIENTWN